MTDTGLSPQERRDLRCIAGLMIPASTEFKVPGADDPKIFADIEKSLGRDLADVRKALATLAGMADMDDAKAGAAAEAFRAAGGAPVAHPRHRRAHRHAERGDALRDAARLALRDV